MKRFVFTTNLYNTEKYSNALSTLWGNKCAVIKVFSVGQIFLEENGKGALVADNDYIGFVNGYLRDGTLESSELHDHNRSVFSILDRNWPLPGHISQSFSAIKITRDKIFLANDVVGFYPLYYSLIDQELIVSSHLIPISRLREVEIDPVGVLQRQVGPSFANFGRRTIIKQCERLLPGELLTFDITPLCYIDSRYDNSLYQNVGQSGQKNLGAIADELWKVISSEYKIALSPWKKTYIALSGGLDSRLALGAIPSDQQLVSLTYGDEKLYESKIAKRLSKVVNAKHYCFQDYAMFFPDKKMMAHYSIGTEAVGVNAWFQILENINTDSDSPIVFGDMCEAVPARKIDSMTSRDFRVREFLSKDLLSEDYRLTVSSAQNFESWKENYRSRYLKRITEVSKEDMLPSSILLEINRDLDLTFDRIEQHHLPYSELFDELMDWHVHARIFMSKQMLLCQNHFLPINPMMSRNVLEAVSNIHPNLRLSYRLMDKMLRRINDLKRFNHIPSAQSAFIPQSSPLFLKLLVWGARSKVDQLLIKRMMRLKDPNKRYRVVDFLNWPKIYQNDKGHQNIENWFAPDYIAKGKEVMTMFDNRKSMESWPLENVDIVSLGGVNIELQLIENI